jgi:prepilin-type processing-associated H-X9-DG protein
VSQAALYVRRSDGLMRFVGYFASWEIADDTGANLLALDGHVLGYEIRDKDGFH